MNCKSCNKPIRFITGRNKKKIPVNHFVEHFIPIESGGDLFITPQGDIRRGKSNSDGITGYRPHLCVERWK